MKLFVFLLLSVSLVSGMNGFSISKDYTKNGFGVPGYVNIMIPDVQDVITTVPGTGPTVITRPSNKGVQTFMQYQPSTGTVAQPSLRWLGRDARMNVPAHAINPLHRGPGSYNGEYGLSRQYIKSPPGK